MTIPDDRRYTDQHEWARLEDGRLRIGITDYAQEALGDVVFVSLPSVGGHVEAGATIAEVESTKSLAEIYAPCSGTIAEVNRDLADTPERINTEPYGQGWLLVLEPDHPAMFDDLLDAAAYAALIA